MNKLTHIAMIILPAAMLLVLCVMITIDMWWAYSLFIIAAACFGACLAFAICGFREEIQKSEAEEEDEVFEIEEEEE